MKQIAYNIKLKHMRAKFLLPLLLLMLVQNLSAQDQLGFIPFDDLPPARITDVGVCVADRAIVERTDKSTQKTDTLIFISEPEVIWQSEAGDVTDSTNVERAMKPRRKARQKILNDSGRWQWGNLNDDFFTEFYYYVFRFDYPSIDAEGNVVMLSAIAACPTPDGASKINNIIIGTHKTITSDVERPSAQIGNFDQDDWGMIFSLAAGPKFILNSLAEGVLVGATSTIPLIGAFSFLIPGVGFFVGSAIMMADIVANVYLWDQLDKTVGRHDHNDNLVVMADYEGYGATKDRAHPYLYQELTARQCVDATRYGRYLYEHDTLLDYLRHPLRKDFRCVSIGYSQGGSVAMACHRFVEQNHLVDELHFAGSICGDGPYDPMATLMYYVSQELEGKNMSMPIVLPLIVKGMLDTNPYMKSHKPEEYFRPEFLATGIFDWLDSKEYSTSGIDDLWEKYVSEHPGAIDYHKTRMTNIMNEECYQYFLKIYNENKDTFTSAAGIPLPKQRGTMEDLHLALASNDLTSGWSPSHRLFLFHSTGDTVVPFVNAERAVNALGEKVVLEKAPNKLDHNDSGVDFFRGDSEIADVALGRILNTRMNDYVGKLCKDKW